MIIMKLRGGLGNQLFQYALGRRLALERGVPLKLDLSWFENQNLRKFELDNFKTKISIASDEEIYVSKYFSHNRYIRHAFLILQDRLPYYRHRVVEENTFGVYDPNILKVPNTCFLSGFWQSEEYFKPVSSIILDEFSLCKPLHPIHKKYADQIEASQAICVHIRRTDYVDDPKNSQLYYSCGVDYYQRAIQVIASLIENPHFFIFSDDIEWTKVNLLLEYPSTYVETKDLSRDYESLSLMSLCKNFIIANSTFSWWGAWLSRNPEKTVIAPKTWFKANVLERKDLIPSRWITI